MWPTSKPAHRSASSMEKRNEHVADEHLRVNSQTGANAMSSHPASSCATRVIESRNTFSEAAA